MGRTRARRQFLKSIPAAIGATLVAPVVADGQTPAAAQSPNAGITADMLGVAQQVAGVSLPAEEREAARTLVARNLANIEAIRAVTLTPDVEPAFSYRPATTETTRTTGATGTTGTTGTENTAAGPLAMSLRARAVTARPAIEDVAFEPVTMLAERIRRRQITSSQLTAMYLDRLKHHDATLFCVVTMLEATAREQAAQADKDISGGWYRGPLHGIPFGIKDLFSVKGVPTTWGAAPYEKQVFDYDATAITRLRDAGAVLLAKLSTGELAVGDLWFRARTRNPWSPDRGSSGSSAGPASATAAGLVGFAVGTETNGSIMSPSSTCGVVGLRPTYGRVSRYGCMTLRWTLDKVGPIARSVEDTSLVLAALHGPDGHDDTVTPRPFSWNGARTVKGVRLGYVEREFAPNAPNAPVLTAALDVYRQAGAVLTPIALPDSPAAAIYALLNAEAGAMFDELVRTGGINQLADKGPNGRANQLRAARFIPAVDYIRAQRVRTLLLRQMNDLFRNIDAFLAPSSSDAVTICNLTGHPAITVPAGFANDLPVGLMVTGPLYREERVLQVAMAFEAATDWHTRRPRGY